MARASSGRSFLRSCSWWLMVLVETTTRLPNPATYPSRLIATEYTILRIAWPSGGAGSGSICSILSCSLPERRDRRDPTAHDCHPEDVVTIAATKVGHRSRFPGVDARPWEAVVARATHLVARRHRASRG